jgi:hypothetical protein
MASRRLAAILMRFKDPVGASREMLDWARSLIFIAMTCWPGCRDPLEWGVDDMSSMTAHLEDGHSQWHIQFSIFYIHKLVESPAKVSAGFVDG